jgi:hypothetical protein
VDTACEGLLDIASGGSGNMASASGRSGDMASASGGSGDMASGLGGTNYIDARPLGWNGIFIMTIP